MGHLSISWKKCQITRNWNSSRIGLCGPSINYPKAACQLVFFGRYRIGHYVFECIRNASKRSLFQQRKKQHLVGMIFEGHSLIPGWPRDGTCRFHEMGVAMAQRCSSPTPQMPWASNIDSQNPKHPLRKTKWKNKVHINAGHFKCTRKICFTPWVHLKTSENGVFLPKNCHDPMKNHRIFFMFHSHWIRFSIAYIVLIVIPQCLSMFCLEHKKICFVLTFQVVCAKNNSKW